MLTLLSIFGVLARLLRPTRGAHTTAIGYLRELGAEVRRNRSRRVRRYVDALTPVEAIEPAPTIPAPRKPVEDAHWDGFPRVEIVRGPYRAWEAHRAELRELAA
ncbi:hypothetical protein [Nocardiopsis oceani]